MTGPLLPQWSLVATGHDSTKSTPIKCYKEDNPENLLIHWISTGSNVALVRETWKKLKKIALTDLEAASIVSRKAATTVGFRSLNFCKQAAIVCCAYGEYFFLKPDASWPNIFVAIVASTMFVSFVTTWGKLKDEW